MTPFLTRRESDRNRTHNTRLDLAKSGALGKDGFIVRQSTLGDWRYGKHDSGYNGCGWIAVYNALLALGCDPGHPAEIIRWLETQPVLCGTILAGHFGTYPWSAGRYFKKHGYCVAYRVTSRYFLPGRTKTYVYGDAVVNIIFYQRTKNLTAHFVTFTDTGARCENGDAIFTFYNDDPEGTPWDQRTGAMIGTLKWFLELQKPLWEVIISIIKPLLY